jgi:hypothetical protein
VKINVDMGHKATRYGANVCSECDCEIDMRNCELLRLSFFKEVKFIVLLSLNIHIISPVRED